MSYLLIRNPGSRAGRGRRLWGAWEEGLRAARVPFRAVETEAPGHARELARGAEPDETVVAVGGDGTINEVLDGVVSSGDATRRMGVLYSGTSPDFCRFHGIPTEPGAALERLLVGVERSVDVARIGYLGPDGEEAVGHLGCSSNIGMGADVARRANRWRPYVGDVPGTALAALRTFAGNRRLDLDLEVDGEPLRLPAVNNLSIAKNPYLASGLRLGLDVQPDDGWLWLAALSGLGRVGLCRVLPSFYFGRAAEGSGLLLRRCKRVSVRCAQAAEVEFDGDPRGGLPCRVELLPGALRLVGGTHDRA
jgi:diacylglycerol kinase family enzyme